MKLRFSVYDVDRRRIRHSLGHVVVPLDELDLGSADVIWRDLEEGIHVRTLQLVSDAEKESRLKTFV